MATIFSTTGDKKPQKKSPSETLAKHMPWWGQPADIDSNIREVLADPDAKRRERMLADIRDNVPDYNQYDTKTLESSLRQAYSNVGDTPDGNVQSAAAGLTAPATTRGIGIAKAATPARVPAQPRTAPQPTLPATPPNGVSPILSPIVSPMPSATPNVLNLQQLGQFAVPAPPPIPKPEPTKTTGPGQSMLDEDDVERYESAASMLEKFPLQGSRSYGGAQILSPMEELAQQAQATQQQTGVTEQAIAALRAQQQARPGVGLPYASRGIPQARPTVQPIQADATLEAGMAPLRADLTEQADTMQKIGIARAIGLPLDQLEQLTPNERQARLADVAGKKIKEIDRMLAAISPKERDIVTGPEAGAAVTLPDEHSEDRAGLRAAREQWMEIRDYPGEIDWSGDPVQAALTFGESIGKGVLSRVRDPRKQIPFGGEIVQAAENLRMRRLAEKVKKGTATEEEQMQFGTAQFAQDWQGQRPLNVPYAGAQVAAEIPRYAAEYAILRKMPGGGQTIEKALLKAMRMPEAAAAVTAADTFVPQTVNQWLRQSVATLASGAAMGAENAPAVAMNMTQRMVDDYATGLSPAGDVVLREIQKSGDDPLTAGAKGLAQSMVEMGTESFGEVLAGARGVKIGQKSIGELQDALKIGMIGKWLRKKGIDPTDTAAALAQLRRVQRTTGVQGIFSETVEEEVGEPLQAIIDGREYNDPLTTKEGRERLMTEVFGIAMFGLPTQIGTIRQGAQQERQARTMRERVEKYRRAAQRKAVAGVADAGVDLRTMRPLTPVAATAELKTYDPNAPLEVTPEAREQFAEGRKRPMIVPEPIAMPTNDQEWVSVRAQASALGIPDRMIANISPSALVRIVNEGQVPRGVQDRIDKGQFMPPRAYRQPMATMTQAQEERYAQGLRSDAGQVRRGGDGLRQGAVEGGGDIQLETPQVSAASDVHQAQAGEAGEIEQQPPTAESKYVPESDIREWQEKQPKGKPSAAYPHKIGTWSIDNVKGLYGRQIRQLVEMPVSDLVMGEEDPRTAPEKRADVRTYTEWASEGNVPPPLNALESDDGQIIVYDGNRRLAAAQEAGTKTLPVWISYRMDTGKKEQPSGKPIYAPLTYEGPTQAQQPQAPASQITDQARAMEDTGAAAPTQPAQQLVQSPKPKSIAVPLEDINTDTKRFQQRKTEFSEESVGKLMAAVDKGEFEWRKFDDIQLWRDPKDQKLYVLAGHSRFEFLKRMREKDPTFAQGAPAQIYEGISEAEAKKIAKQSNVLGTRETDIERAGYYRGLRTEGKKRKEIDAEAKLYEGKNAKYVLDISHLNPNGAALQDLSTLDRTAAKENVAKMQTIAQWLGQVRQEIPELSDTHENELYKWLRTGSGQAIRTSGEFIDRVEQVVRPMIESKRLKSGVEMNIQDRAIKSATRAQYDSILEEAKRSVKAAQSALEAKRSELVTRKASEADMTRILKPLDDAVTIAQRDLAQIKSQRDIVDEAEAAQGSIFDMMTPEEETAEAAANLVAALTGRESVAASFAGTRSATANAPTPVNAGADTDLAASAASMPETIDVDGTERPTRNSEGRLIESDPEKLRNFWRWFGDSKVVDEQGRPLVVYHGSDQSGFRKFDTAGGERGRHGSFFTSNYRMAASYTRKDDDAPVFSPEDAFKNPDEIDGLEIETRYTIVDARGNQVIGETYDSEDEVRSNHEAGKGQKIAERYNVFYDGSEEAYEATRKDAVAAIGEIEAMQPGIYSVYLRLIEPEVVKWNGNNWDDGPEEDIWELRNEEGDTEDWAYTQEGADAFVAKYPGSTAEKTTQKIFEDTNDVARRAEDFGVDGAIIRDVEDVGQYGRGYESGDVFIVFSDKNIKSAQYNRGTYSAGDADITHSKRIPQLRPQFDIFGNEVDPTENEQQDMFADNRRTPEDIKAERDGLLKRIAESKAYLRRLDLELAAAPENRKEFTRAKIREEKQRLARLEKKAGDRLTRDLFPEEKGETMDLFDMAASRNGIAMPSEKRVKFLTEKADEVQAEIAKLEADYKIDPSPARARALQDAKIRLINVYYEQQFGPSEAAADEAASKRSRDTQTMDMFAEEAEETKPESIFIRLATKAEQNSPSAKSRAMGSMMDDAPEGYEIVYKPYGEKGKGFYYSKVQSSAEKFAGKPTPAQQMDEVFNRTQAKIDAFREEVEQRKAQPKEYWQIPWENMGGVKPNGMPNMKHVLTGAAADEYSRQHPGEAPYFNTMEAAEKWATSEHRKAVAKAVREGKLVPLEVLNDYPDIAKKRNRDAVPIANVAKQYGWTVEAKDNGDIEVSNSKGVVVEVVKVKKGKWEIFDRAGTKLMSGNNAVEQGVAKVAEQYYYAKKLASDDRAASKRTQTDDLPRDMVATHGLSIRNLLLSIREGGIPAPSLAVLPLEFAGQSGFGPAVLVAKAQAILPEEDYRNAVFDADAYAPRHPEIMRDPKRKAVENFVSDVSGAAKELGESYWYNGDDKMRRGFSQGLDALEDDTAKYYYLTRVKGEKIDVPMRDRYGTKEKEADTWALRDILTERIDETEYQEWADGIADTLYGEPYILRGKKKTEPTLANIVDAMMSRGARAKEAGMTYSIGKARAAGAKKLASRAAIKRQQSRIGSREDVEAARKKTTKVFFDLTDKFEYKYSSDWQKNDDFSKAVGMFLKGARTRARAASVLQANDFIVDANRSPLDEFMELADMVWNAPVPYFEAKPAKPVMLRDFAGVAIPDDTPQSIIDKIEAAGLKVEKYAEGQQGEAIRRIADTAPEDIAFSKSSLPPTITIDGVDRPTKNSEGRQIAGTEEEVRNFWKWFGDSKVVDEQGRPRVVYHGTNADFDTYDASYGGSATGSASGRSGFFFTSDPNIATNYALFSARTAKRGEGDPKMNLMPVYLRILSPNAVEKKRTERRLFDENRKDAEIMRAKEDGNDGVIATGFSDSPYTEKKSDVYVVFDRGQIKSATGNRGTFSPEDPDITHSKPKGTQAQILAEEKRIAEEAVKDTPDDFKQRVFDHHQMIEDGAFAAVSDEIYLRDKTERPYSTVKLHELGHRFWVRYAPDALHQGILNSAGNMDAIVGKSTAKWIRDNYDSWQYGQEMEAELFRIVAKRKAQSRQVARAIADRLLKFAPQNFRETTAAKLGDMLWGAYRMAENVLDAFGSDRAKYSYAVARFVSGSTEWQRHDPDRVPWLRRMNDNVKTEALKLGYSLWNQGAMDPQLFAARFKQEVKKIDPNAVDAIAPHISRVYDAVARAMTTMNPGVTAPQNVAWQIEDESRIQKFMARLTDEFNSVKRLEKAVTEAGGAIPEEAKVYRTKRLSKGVTRYRLEDAKEKLIDPLVQSIANAKKRGIAMEEIALYLIARHAPERNAEVARRNEYADEWMDGGSGMTNEEAKAIMDDYTKRNVISDISLVARRFDAITQAERDIRRKNLEGPEAVQAWEDMFKHYVPLRTAETPDMVGRPLRKGQWKTYRTKSFAGRKSLSDNPIEWAVAQLTDAIINDERNDIRIALYNAAKEFPNPDVWEVDQTPRVRTVSKTTGIVKEIADPTYTRLPNVITATIEGVDHHIEVKDPVMARQFMAIGQTFTSEDAANAIVRMLGVPTRWLTKLTTGFNPPFMLTNFVKDSGFATAQVQARHGAAKAKEFAKSLPSAVEGIWRVNFPNIDAKRAAKGKQTPNAWSPYLKRFKVAGGQMGWYSTRSIADIAKDIERQVAQINEDDRGVRKLARKGRMMIDVVERANEAVELGTRLAYFKLLVDGGMSDKDAALAAREITVDFDQKGEWGRAMNSVWAFSNAAVQGTVVFAKFMAGPAGRKIAAATFGASFAHAIAMRLAGGSDDEDGRSWYEKRTTWERESNVVLVIPGTDGAVVKVPVPHGLGWFWSLGQIAADAVYDAADGPFKATPYMQRTLESAMSAFNPLGGGPVEQIVTPTALEPFVQTLTNKTFTGSPVMPEPPPFREVPDHTLAFKSTPGTYRTAATKIAEITGGSQYEPGLIDVSPETIQLYTEFVFGGLGKTLTQVAGLPADAISAAQGDTDALDPRNVPGLGRFAGITDDNYATETRYREIMQEVKRAKDIMRDMTPQERAQYVKKNKEIVIFAQNTPDRALSNQISALRERMNAADASGKYDVRDRIAKQIMTIQKRIIKRYPA